MRYSIVRTTTTTTTTTTNTHTHQHHATPHNTTPHHNNTTTTPKQHHTADQNVANSAPATHSGASKHLTIASEGTCPLYFQWHVFYAGILGQWYLASFSPNSERLRCSARRHFGSSRRWVLHGGVRQDGITSDFNNFLFVSCVCEEIGRTCSPSGLRLGSALLECFVEQVVVPLKEEIVKELQLVSQERGPDRITEQMADIPARLRAWRKSCQPCRRW